MAQSRVKGITIELNGDATGLDKALKGVNKEIRDTEAELRDVNRLLKLDPGNTELLAQKQKLLTKEIGDTSEKLKTLKSAAKDAEKALANGEITEKQYDALQREIISTENKLKGLETQANETGQALAHSGEVGAKAFDSEKMLQGLKTFGQVAGAAITAIGTASLAASKKFVSLAQETAEFGDTVDKMSQKLGISAEAYQKWDFILQQNGASIESLKAPMKTLATQAQKGSDAFQKLGISQEEVASLSQEDLFAKTIEGLQRMGEGTERTALASQLLGKASVELGPLLNQSAEDTQALAEQAEKFGFIMSDEAVKAAAAFDDSMNVLSQTLEGLKNKMMAEFLPALTQVTDGLALVFTGDMSGLDMITEGVDGIISQLSEVAPKLLEIGETIVEGLADGIIGNLDKLLGAATELVMSLTTYIIQNLPLIIQASVEMIQTLAEGLIQALPDLIPAITETVLWCVEYLTDPTRIDQFITVGAELIMAVGEGFIKALPILLKKLPIIMMNLTNEFIFGIPMMISKIANKLSAGFIEIVNKAKKWGQDMVNGFINGLMSMIGKVANAASNIANKIKSYLHFSRPDEGPLRDYESWMPDFVEGLTRTLNASSYKLTNAVSNMADEMQISMTVPNGITSMLGQYLPYLATHQTIVLDTGVLVGETAPMYNKALGTLTRQGG